MGRYVPELNTIEFMNFYSLMLKEKDCHHFGVFHGKKMLAYGSLSPAFHPSGLQVVYFVREAFLMQNIGRFTLGAITRFAWLELDVDFVQAVVDKANIGSRRIVKSQGYEPLYALTALGQGESASNTQICYVYLNPRLKLKASVHSLRGVDLIGHFCFIPELQHLIDDEVVNEYFRWKFPIYQEDDLDLF